MISLLPNPRYERKFIATDCALAEVIGLVRRHPAAFREAYPARLVNNLYFDTPSLRDYHDHVNGAASRSKTRLRWYGPCQGAVLQPALERKLKRGLVSGKIAHALPPISVPSVPALHEFVRLLLDCGPKAPADSTGIPSDGVVSAAAQKADLLLASLRQMRPTLLNRYDRQYFVSRDGRFRLTIDSGLEFGNFRDGNGLPAFHRPSSLPPIIELKYPPQHAEAASLVTNRIPFRLARSSKYVLGLETLGAR